MCAQGPRRIRTCAQGRRPMYAQGPRRIRTCAQGPRRMYAQGPRPMYAQGHRSMSVRTPARPEQSVRRRCAHTRKNHRAEGPAFHASKSHHPTAIVAPVARKAQGHCPPGPGVQRGFLQSRPCIL
jgi:hypothetical protein